MPFWIITGDKPETAVEVGRQIGMLDNHNLVTLHGQVQTGKFGKNTWLIEGSELHNLTDEQLKDFVKKAIDGNLIAARVSPSQKARICAAVKEFKNVMAVGDGSNDVGMIRTADLGIGMRGR